MVSLLRSREEDGEGKKKSRFSNLGNLGKKKSTQTSLIHGACGKCTGGGPCAVAAAASVQAASRVLWMLELDGGRAGAVQTTKALRGMPLCVTLGWY